MGVDYKNKNIMTFNTQNLAVESHYNNLSRELIDHSWITVEESHSVADWHSVLCRVIDAGEETSIENIAYALTGRTNPIGACEPAIHVPDHVPDNIEELPRIDGVATDSNLGLVPTKQEVDLCTVDLTNKPIVSNTNTI